MRIAAVTTENARGLRTPFDWVRERDRARLLLVLTVLLGAVSLWLTTTGTALVTPEAPYGIVSYELAGSAERAEAILHSWSPRARDQALLIQGVDSLYLLVYPAWIALAILLLSKTLDPGWRCAGAAIAWAVLLAAPFDAVENHALVAQLLDGASERSAQLAWACAAAKFALVGVGILYLLAAGSRRLLIEPVRRS